MQQGELSKMEPQICRAYIAKEYAIVRWRDAACDDDANTEKAWRFNCPPVETVGYILDQDKNRIVLATHRNRELTKDDLVTDAGEQTWYIPWGMIEDIQVLKPEGNKNESNEPPKIQGR